MAGRKINQGLKTALEMGPVLAFFVAYLWLKGRSFTVGGTDYDGFIVATAAFIPIFMLSIAVLWWLTGHLSKMQIMTAVLIIVFGGMSVWFNDPSFFKMKPTIIYLLFAGLLGVGLLRGESWLEYVMEGVMPLSHRGWMILTRRLMFFFLALAVLNEVIWRSMSEEAWVYFKTFGLTAAIFVFFLSQGRLFRDHAAEPATQEGGEDGA